MRKRRWTNEDLQNAVRKSFSMSGTMRELGLINSGNRTTIKKDIERLSLDISHWTGQGHGTTSAKIVELSMKKKKKLSEDMVEESTYGRGHLKRRVIKEGVLEYRCAESGNNGWWRDRPAVPVLDHINGIGNDHRLEN